MAETFRDEPRASDADAIERLVTRAGNFNAAEIAIARELIDENLAKGPEASGYYFLFADGPEGLEGYSCYGPVPGANRRFEIYWIAVDPGAQRGGLGAKLQGATEDKVKAMGGVYLVAETSTLPAYAAARRFYTSKGFKLIAEVPDWHDDGDGLAIYRKKL